MITFDAKKGLVVATVKANGQPDRKQGVGKKTGKPYDLIFVDCSFCGQNASITFDGKTDQTKLVGEFTFVVESYRFERQYKFHKFGGRLA